MRRLGVLALLVPFLGVPSASAAPPPEVLAWTTSAGAWVSVAGAPATLVVPGAVDVDVSPDGTRLAWIKGASTRQLFTSGIDGSGATALTSGAGAGAGRPQFSPDGSTIAYAWGADQDSRLRTISASGGAYHDVVASGRYVTPTWSPDGAFLAVPGSGGMLMVTDKGTQPWFLNENDLILDPAWSPDGKTILFGAQDVDGLYAVKSMTVATGAVTVLVPDATSPAWTPDGSHFYDRTLAGRLERRTADGTLDGTFAPVEGADNPSVGGGAPPARDATAPGPVSGLTVAPSASQVDLDSTLPSDADIAGVVVRYAEGSTPPVSVTDGMPAGRSLSGGLNLKRLLADTTYSFSVFAIDWSGNVSAPASVTVSTPHVVLTTFRTRTSAQRVTYGSPVTESARLIREDTGAFAANQLVQLFGHHKSEPDKLLATARTDANGLVRFVRRPLAPAYYTMKYNGDGQLLSGRGYTYVGVTYRVVAVLTPHIARLGQPATLSVTVLPAIKGLRVTVAQVLRNQQVGGAVMFLDANGRCSTRLDTSKHGNERLYLAVLAAQGYSGFETTLGFGVA